MLLLIKVNMTCLGFSLLCRQITFLHQNLIIGLNLAIHHHEHKSIIGLNLLQIVFGLQSRETTVKRIVKQELRFMLKFSRMSMMDGSEGPSREVVESEADGLISEGEFSQVTVDNSICSKCVKYDKCSELEGKLSELETKFKLTFNHNQHLIVDLSKCTDANMVLKQHEKEFKTIIETLKKDVSELTKTVSRKKTAINNYINMLEETKKVLACAKCESDAIQLKLDSYSDSRYLLDHIIDIQKKKGNVKCIGYQSCPPLIRHNYTKMPDEEDRPCFEPSVSLDIEEFIVGLGYKRNISSDQAQSADVKDSTTAQDQDPLVIIEDCDSSDDESNEDDAKQSNTMTKESNKPPENRILCDPQAKLCVSAPAKNATAPVKNVETHVETYESANLLYT
ncbi:hypothetical protein Hanom_Chr04g00297811 [Helianthus anomalus]